jgi:hypothetical protein
MLRLLPKAALALTLAAAGCAPAASKSPRLTAATACHPDQAVLVVRNNTGSEADIVRFVGPQRSVLVAVAPPGRSEVNVPSDRNHVYSAERRNRTISSTGRTGGVPVTLDYECRRA